MSLLSLQVWRILGAGLEVTLTLYHLVIKRMYIYGKTYHCETCLYDVGSKDKSKSKAYILHGYMAYLPVLPVINPQAMMHMLKVLHVPRIW